MVGDVNLWLHDLFYPSRSYKAQTNDSNIKVRKRSETKPKMQHWFPLSCLTEIDKDERKIALVILNHSLSEINHNRLKTLWDNASITICVDGGANALYDITKDNENGTWLPEYLTGDFDSVRPSVLDYYQQKGVKIVKTPDQDNSDFTKALAHLVSVGGDQKVSAIVVLCEFSGRLDQTLGNIHTCFQAAKMTDKHVIQLAHDCAAFILKPGEHRIDVSSGFEGTTCGLIPIGGKCHHVTTTGLKWNLYNTSLEFGELISTSNAFNGSGVVDIETSHTLLWTMAVKP